MSAGPARSMTEAVQNIESTCSMSSTNIMPVRHEDMYSALHAPNLVSLPLPTICKQYYFHKLICFFLQHVHQVGTWRRNKNSLWLLSNTKSVQAPLILPHRVSGDRVEALPFQHMVSTSIVTPLTSVVRPRKIFNTPKDKTAAWSRRLTRSTTSTACFHSAR